MNHISTRALLTLIVSIALTIKVKGQFNPLEQVLTLADPSSMDVLSVDIDADGDQDICINYGNQISAAINNGNAEFTEQSLFNLTLFVPLNSPSGWWGTSFIDLDEDGLVDFVQNKLTSIEWRKNNGDLTFSAPVVIAEVDQVTLSPEGLYPTNDWYTVNYLGMTTGDLDQDGHNEVVFARGISANNPATNFISTVFNSRIESIEFINGSQQPAEERLSDINQAAAGFFPFGFQVELTQHFLQFFLQDLNADAQPDLTFTFFYDTGIKGLSFYNTGEGFEHAYGISDFNGYNQYLPVNLDNDPSLEIVNRYDFSFTQIDMPSAIPSEFAEVPFFANYFMEIEAGFFAGNIPAGKVIDLYGDGYSDLVFASGDGVMNLLVNNQNNGFEGEYESGFFGAFNLPQNAVYTNLSTIVAIEVGDYNNDGRDDLAVLSTDALYLYLAPSPEEPQPSIGTYLVSTFFDANANGIRDANEITYDYNEYTINSIYTAYGMQSTIELSADTGIIQVSPIFNEAGFTVVPPSAALNFDNLTDTLLFEFAVQSLNPSPVDELEVLFNQSNVCEISTVSCYIFNGGNTVLGGDIEITLDAALTVLNITGATLISQTGQVLQLALPPTNPLITHEIRIRASNPGTSVLGNTATSSYSINATNNFGTILSEQTGSTTSLYQCAYDPNYIEELTGHTEQGYVFDGSRLVYRIHFQNLGNAPAQNVRIEDLLNEQFDMQSLNILAASHPVTLTFTSDNLANFLFENIQLPDSASDPLGSQGYVLFTIDLQPGLSFLDQITNRAAIFFDNNEPIITNDALNTIYDCSDLNNLDASDNLLCASDVFSGGSNAVWIENISWSYLEQLSNERDFQFEANDTGLLELSVSNALCSATDSWNITVDAPTAAFTINGNDLVAEPAAAYQWYLNGNVIEGATSGLYTIQQSGLYSVQITSNAGCTATSASQNAVYTRVAELIQGGWNVFPNPCTHTLRINVMQIHDKAQLQLFDAAGKEVFNFGRLTSTSTELDFTALQPGVYFLKYQDYSMAILKQ